MSTLDPVSKLQHFDLNDPKDLSFLVRAKWFWSSCGPQAAQKAITAIAEGDAPYSAAVPPSALKLINALRNQLGKPPLGDVETPAEEPAPTEEPEAPEAETPVEEAAPAEEPE